MRAPGASGRRKNLDVQEVVCQGEGGIVVEFISTNMGVAEACRKYGISPTTFDNWRRRFMDAGKRELAGIGGNGRSDPAKALARENESLKIVAGEQALALAELKKSLE